ncbi:MAG: D-2-hydroxyacid dehydrogenase [Planctomycetota bacterium]
MNLKKIVTCFPLADSQIQRIVHEFGNRFEIVVSDQDRIADDIFEAHIFCGHAKVPVDWPAVVQQGRLQWIQSSAAGLDHCLHPSVIESQILVSGCSGLFSRQVAEQSMALLMGLMRRMPVFFRAQQLKEFVRRPTDNLFGKTVGIIGFGGNGQRIAKTLRPLTDRILATDCFPQAGKELIDQGVVEAIYPADELETILSQAEVTIVTLPLSEMNEKLISREAFEVMKPGAYLINVGRGSVIDTNYLVEFLENGRLAGAGIDVVDPEPLPPESRLWEMDNVIISPHVGAQSPLRVPSTVELFCKNVDLFEAGKSLLNEVDKKLGFPRPENRVDWD